MPTFPVKGKPDVNLLEEFFKPTKNNPKLPLNPRPAKPCGKE